MNSIKKSRMIIALISSIAMIGSFSQLSFASGSYAPPQARGVKSVKVELYHLGKRLTLKRVTPTQADGVKEDKVAEQQATLKSLAAQIQKKQEQVASGKELIRPSDDPVKAARVMVVKEQQAQAKQHLRNIDLSYVKLSLTDSAFQVSGPTSLRFGTVRCA